MKFLAQTLMGSGLGLILLTATPSFASVTGNLYLGGTGTVTVTGTSITFNENNTTPSGSSTAVGVGTTLTLTGGTVTPGDPVDINGADIITPATLAAGVPLAFPDTPSLTATITSFGPGSTNTDCAGLTTGESCSPLIGTTPSPIILTYTGPGTESSTAGTGPNEGTDAVLDVSGIASDGTMPNSTFSGAFSATIPDETPESLETLFAATASASFSTTYSGSFTTTPGTKSVVPEPRETSLIAAASLLMGLAFFKRRKKVQG